MKRIAFNGFLAIVTGSAEARDPRVCYTCQTNSAFCGQAVT
jgi:hypothetical protein